MRSFSAGALMAAAIALATPAHAQQPSHLTSSDPRFGVCIPRSERAGRAVGCFIVTDQALDSLPAGPVFWHVTRFGTLRSAEAARGPNSVVLTAYGAAWLLTVADSAWRPATGRHVAAIGPLPVLPGTRYSALYMEASMRPGMTTPVHRHSGIEAWYTLRGETCLETPDGSETGRAGGPPVIVPAGLPMRLTATGHTLRQSLVLILHDATRPPTTMDSTWTPRGLCRA